MKFTCFTPLAAHERFTADAVAGLVGQRVAIGMPDGPDAEGTVIAAELVDDGLSITVDIADLVILDGSPRNLLPE